MSASRVLELIAPSGYAPDNTVIQRGVDKLQSLGFAVQNLAATQRRHLRFAGTAAERVAEINALADPDRPLPDVILAVRGGYGAVQLLAELDYDALGRRFRDAPVPIVGHSDFTALQMALLARADITTFAGPMLLADFGASPPSDFTQHHFAAVLDASEHRVQWQMKAEDGGGQGGLDVSGRLWGGNLAMLCSLIGTPYFPQVDGGILFVEDVNEPPYRVERMLYQLHLAGVLHRQKALILGDFSQYRVTDYDNGYDMAPMVEAMRAVTGVPIVTGLPFGHTADKLTLPVGGQAHLVADATQATLTMSHYPHKAA